MATHKIKSYAKINLALNIVGKTSSLHKIETIVAFIDLFDDILIKKIKSKKNKVEFVGKFSKSITNNNTVTKLLNILEKKKLLKGKKFKIRITSKSSGKQIDLNVKFTRTDDTSSVENAEGTLFSKLNNILCFSF